MNVWIWERHQTRWRVWGASLIACCLVQSLEERRGLWTQESQGVGGGGTPCRRHYSPESGLGSGWGCQAHRGLVSHLKDLGVCPGAMGKSLKATWWRVQRDKARFLFWKSNLASVAGGWNWIWIGGEASLGLRSWEEPRDSVTLDPGSDSADGSSRHNLLRASKRHLGENLPGLGIWVWDGRTRAREGLKMQAWVLTPPVGRELEPFAPHKDPRCLTS